MAKPRLTALDWIQAGFRALRAGGLQAVKAEPLARALGVSKGSFYWHFKGLDDFHSRMIAHWEQRATADIIAAVEDGGGSAADRLWRLIELATSEMDSLYGGPLTEVSIRDWAQVSDRVAETFYRVDAARLAFLETLLRDHGFEEPEATLHAKLIYYSFIGSTFAPSEDRRPILRDLLDRILATPIPDRG